MSKQRAPCAPDTPARQKELGAALRFDCGEFEVHGGDGGNVCLY
jgi:hypothetical protein